MELGYTAAALIGLVLGGRVAPPTGEVDYDALYRFAHEHNIVPLIAFGLKKAGLLPPEQAGRFGNDLRVAMAMEATQEVYLQRLSEAFRAENIKYMPLKGCVMKHLYPQPFLRTMCDLDIQYDWTASIQDRPDQNCIHDLSMAEADERGRHRQRSDLPWRGKVYC